ncbi:hypothetical protein [Aeropyrum camini]|uniref:hypothetical protein n=1 Tax=Aeropyrum camini TaxID=229980 RepID=UPI000786CAF1|nr:hypothetical protein [Aeropyrum camini]
MSREMIGLGASILIRLLLRNIRKKKQHLQETAPPQLTKEQIDRYIYIVDTTIDEAYKQLLAEYDRAYQELLQREKEIDDPHIKTHAKHKRIPLTIQARQHDETTVDAHSHPSKRSPKTWRKRQGQDMPVHPKGKLEILQRNSPNPPLKKNTRTNTSEPTQTK